MENDSMTDRGPPYHNAAIDGETPETRDPRHNTGLARSLGQALFVGSHSARQEIPGLEKYDISTAEVGAPAGPSGIHPMATLYFDSLNAIKAGLTSPQGQAAAGDPANFAGGRAELYFF